VVSAAAVKAVVGAQKISLKCSSAIPEQTIYRRVARVLRPVYGQSDDRTERKSPERKPKYGRDPALGPRSDVRRTPTRITQARLGQTRIQCSKLHRMVHSVPCSRLGGGGGRRRGGGSVLLG
jgi:hypothetical protein